MKKKILREYWIAVPPPEYEGPPAVWLLEQLAKTCVFPKEDKTQKIGYKLLNPVEVIHVREVK